MGFLDHSTNNIIIDAVLTDYGRMLLAEGSGDFIISYFSLSDDEVDYGMITKFGRTVGTEKITKNTPIFEAQTKHMSAIKNRMITLPNPSITRIPLITFSDPNQSDTLSFVKNNAGTGYQPLEVSMKQSVGNSGALNPDGLTDSNFTVYVNSRFMIVNNLRPMSEEPVSRIAAYTIDGLAPGQNNFRFNLNAKTISSETFTQYGVASGDSTVITTPVIVIGNQTGIRKDFKVTISS